MIQYNGWFERFLKAAEKTGDIMLRYQYQKDMIKESLLNKAQLDKLKNEIVSDLLPRINVTIPEEALKELKRLLEELGQ